MMLCDMKINEEKGTIEYAGYDEEFNNFMDKLSRNGREVADEIAKEYKQSPSFLDWDTENGKTYYTVHTWIPILETDEDEEILAEEEINHIIRKIKKVFEPKQRASDLLKADELLLLGEYDNLLEHLIESKLFYKDVISTAKELLNKNLSRFEELINKKIQIELNRLIE